MGVVGSPTCLADRGVPNISDDLSAHHSIGLRFLTHGGLAERDSEKAGRALNVRVEPRLIVNDARLQRQVALSGAGLAYVMEILVRPDLVAGSLVQVLQDWCPPFRGYHLYFPSRRHRSPALAVVTEVLRYKG